MGIVNCRNIDDTGTGDKHPRNAHIEEVKGEVYTDADIPKKALAYFSVALSIDAYIHSFHPPPPRKSLSYISAGTQTQSLVLKAQSPPHTSGIGVHYEQYFNVAKLTEALLDPTNPRLSPKQPICTDVVGSDSVEGKYIKAAKLVDGIVSNCDDNISDGAHADAGGQASFLEEDPKPAAAVSVSNQEEVGSGLKIEEEAPTASGVEGNNMASKFLSTIIAQQAELNKDAKSLEGMMIKHVDEIKNMEIKLGGKPKTDYPEQKVNNMLSELSKLYQMRARMKEEAKKSDNPKESDEVLAVRIEALTAEANKSHEEAKALSDELLKTHGIRMEEIKAIEEAAKTKEELAKSKRAAMDPLERLFSLKKRMGNECCADCQSSDVTQADVTHNVLLCQKCANIHVDAVKAVVKNLEYMTTGDNSWELKYVEGLEAVGNNLKQNMNLEFRVPFEFRKPTADDEAENRVEYIVAKYDKKFVRDPRETNPVRRAPFPAWPIKIRKKKHESVRKNKKGSLKVKLLCGTELSTGGIDSNFFNPYVTVAYGTQISRSYTKNGTANPTWNGISSAEPEFGYMWRKSLKEPLIVELYHEDLINGDRKIGSVSVELKGLPDAKTTTLILPIFAKGRKPIKWTELVKTTKKDGSDPSKWSSRSRLSVFNIFGNGELPGSLELSVKASWF
ncbi:hypothetical protein AAMO2058_000875800 [Amorphochlora amoebiformis]